MRKGQLPILAESTFADTLDYTANPASKFAGTDNPRHFRVIHSLLTGPRKREAIDRIAGASNGPELVAELRRKGLEVPCRRVPDFDRDGLPIRRGVYYFSTTDRAKINRWLALREAARSNHEQ
ncbi:MAG: hypothetical protein Q8K59_09255 [Nitrosomonas sp.]|nr:hypothetical protein [Nitrosomonas sp.]MDP1951262.1 hypothetical protein [Nitrosomonas sp.]